MKQARFKKSGAAAKDAGDAARAEEDLYLFYRVLQEFPDAFQAVRAAMEMRRAKPPVVVCSGCEEGAEEERLP